jgi:hypothetical protein
VTPFSGYRSRLLEDEDHSVHLEPHPRETALGQAVLETLDRSRFVDPLDRNFFNMTRAVAADKQWHEDLMKRYGYKTKRAAYAMMLYCLAERREGWILITPYKRDRKPGLWSDLPDEKTVLIPATLDPGIVGAAVSLALSHCE